MGSRFCSSVGTLFVNERATWHPKSQQPTQSDTTLHSTCLLQLVSLRAEFTMHRLSPPSMLVMQQSDRTPPESSPSCPTRFVLLLLFLQAIMQACAVIALALCALTSVMAAVDTVRQQVLRTSLRAKLDCSRSLFSDRWVANSLSKTSGEVLSRYQMRICNPCHLCA